MMTQQLGYSILTAPLAAIDRRALSQAWYSALHVARQQAAPAARALHAQPARAGAGDVRSVPERPHRRAPDTPVRANGAANASRSGASAGERRAPRSRLARRIEHTFLDPVRRTARATFTLDGTQARVHVALQATTAGLRLIAVCPAPARDGVVKALDQARYALAARGIALSVEMRETGAR